MDTMIRHINRQQIQKLLRRGLIVVDSDHPTITDYKNTCINYEINRENYPYDAHQKGEIYGERHDE